MVEDRDEAVQARLLVERVAQEVREELGGRVAEAILIANSIKIGLMIESKTAVQNRADIMSHADFVNVGLNDLVNDVRGVSDRSGILTLANTNVSLEVISMLPLLLESARESGIELCLCGEWAGNMGIVLNAINAAAQIEGSNLSFATRLVRIPMLKSL